MPSTLTTIKEEEDSDAVDSNSDDGSKADELDNAFNGETNMANDEGDEQAGDEAGAVIPDIPDHYNDLKGLNDGVEHKITANSNKYAWEHMRLYKKFGGQRWKSVTVEEMKINMAAKNAFHIEPKLAFDEGGVATQGCFCYIRQYNKDKLNKKNAENIDVDEKVTYLPTTMKAVVNTYIASGIANDLRGAHTLYLRLGIR
eukprot:5077777-Ditylum_brightwellii.AAC.1